MSHAQESHGASPESIAAGHETTDADPKNIVLFVIWLTVSVVISVLITLVLFWEFTSTEEAATQAEFASSPLLEQRPPPPSPPIQPSAVHPATELMDRQEYFAEYNRLAGSFGQETMADHQVHDRIPVDAAIALLAQNGLPPGPAATDVPAPQGVGNSMPTPYSEGGRGSATGVEAAPGVPQK